jgi:hypothetical protein
MSAGLHLDRSPHVNLHKLCSERNVSVIDNYRLDFQSPHEVN